MAPNDPIRITKSFMPMRPRGSPLEDLSRVLTKAGYAGHFLNACGYTMGATYPPTWMDWPMVYAGEPQVLAPNMLFFLHMILLNSDTGLSMSLGETAIITEAGCEPISHAPRHLLAAKG